jgi:acyl-homoserine lactone acylase PvdQ
MSTSANSRLVAGLPRTAFKPGQSGNPLSRHYRDLTALWARGESIPMTRRPEVYGESAIGRLRLIPAPD